MLPVVIRPAPDTSFALMDGRPVLFSEKNQKIYELDRAGAYIWCKLLERQTIGTIFDGLAGSGIERWEARQFVRRALHQWLDLSLVDVDWDLSADFALQTRLARHLILIQASSKQLLERVAPLFCNAGRGTDQGDVLIEIIGFDDQILFRVNKTWIRRCELDGLAPAIRAYLIERVIRHGQPDFALHAASLISNRTGLLLCGEPGAGKSTLTLHLADAGFQYGGDDIVLVAPDGRAEGVPFAPTVKPGAWELISKLRSDLEDAAVHRRPDGVRVQYLPVAHVHDGSFSIDRIIFLNRIEGAAAALTPLGQIESMGRVIDGSFASDGKLSRLAFVALKRTLERAKSFELTYSDAVQARPLLEELCHGRP